MAKRYWRFTVRGTGQFPFDMLRYDQCWPTDNTHALAGTEPREVRMLGVNQPTVDRWISFGWMVDKMERTTY